MTGQKKQQHSHLEHENNIYATPTEKADVFATTLEEVYQPPTDPGFDNDFYDNTETTITSYLHQQRIPVEDRDCISEEEVWSVISTRKGRTAPGADGLSYNILKRLPEQAINIIAIIMTACYKLGYHPALWRMAVIVMIAKTGKDSKDPSSYRPISLLCCLSKVYEKILCDKLKSFLSETNALPIFQFGFRAKHSVQDAILRFTTSVTTTLNARQTAAAVFLDIERAFDRLWHAGIIKKLLHLGVPDPLIRAIAAFLTGRTAKIRVGNCMSRIFRIEAGAPQGSVLSPTLFSIYCTDIPVPDGSTYLQQYADDTVCWSSARLPTTATRMLQTHLHQLESWMRRWRIRPNPSKSHFLIIHHRHFPVRENLQLRLWQQDIIPTRQTTYLGHVITDTMNWRPDIHLCSVRMRQRMSLIYMLRGRIRGCSLRTQLLTYKMFVRPLVDFRAVAYAGARRNLLQEIAAAERRFFRRVHRLPPDFPTRHLEDVTFQQQVLDRIADLQRRFTVRRISEENAVNADLLRQLPPRITRKPRYKYPYPPLTLLSRVPDLPEDLHAFLENAPLTIRN